ncbi:hypothetical protein GDO86_007430 [Hymenochirus boettgeri]|uniref:Uncharacterized protein n=1 Tax=Hymenochirus boettgeri TaxID=247094 RepID=A0A8T2IZ30_9PIPI|nr:hypothetical protein GDO86_007430 [Hymenochirus boettgeri]
MALKFLSRGYDPYLVSSQMERVQDRLTISNGYFININLADRSKKARIPISLHYSPHSKCERDIIQQNWDIITSNQSRLFITASPLFAYSWGKIGFIFSNEMNVYVIPGTGKVWNLLTDKAL